jgi:hypothetical protein
MAARRGKVLGGVLVYDAPPRHDRQIGMEAARPSPEHQSHPCITLASISDLVRFISRSVITPCLG